MAMTPLELKILLKCYISEYQYDNIPNTPLSNAIEKFVAEQLIRYKSNCAHTFVITEKGQKFISVILKTKLPISKTFWVDGNGDIIS